VLCLRRTLIVTVTLATVVIATLDSLVLTPFYASTCRIKIQGENDGLSGAPFGTSARSQLPHQSAPAGYKFGK
jgi:uncharacterized protein involved in exopolysaccharide biosynthesis